MQRKAKAKAKSPTWVTFARPLALPLATMAVPALFCGMTLGLSHFCAVAVALALASIACKLAN